ncbi:hypothetical protein HYS29_00020, partial [Candidatus Microgenomates bacterium]|nr:hypothetical protein [Candidatus Microgenomates bacterium]
MRKLVILLVVLVAFLAVWSVVWERFIPPKIITPQPQEKVKVVDEESVVVEVVEKVTPSVVTVGVERKILEFDPFDPFGILRRPKEQGSRD